MPKHFIYMFSEFQWTILRSHKMLKSRVPSWRIKTQNGKNCPAGCKGRHDLTTKHAATCAVVWWFSWTDLQLFHHPHPPKHRIALTRKKRLPRSRFVLILAKMVDLAWHCSCTLGCIIFVFLRSCYEFQFEKHGNVVVFLVATSFDPAEFWVLKLQLEMQTVRFWPI